MHFHVNATHCLKVYKVKPLILHHPEQVLARLVGLMRRFQTEQFRVFLRVEENPEGKPPGIGCEG